MTLLLSIFVNDLVPICAAAAIGFLLARYLRADAKTVSRVTFNLVLMYTVGVFLASHGRAGLGRALVNVFKAPVMYAVAAAGAVMAAHVQLPASVMRPVELLSPITLTLLIAAL